MKANEAPEKIYLVIDPVWGSMSVNYNRNDTNNIEYIREDVFIEKAREFLSKESNIPLWEGYNDDFGCDTRKLVENFINYMKGE